MKKTKKIAIVKMWPNHVSAEQENIQRIKLSANKLGIEVIEIDNNGLILGTNNYINKNDVEFVVNLHFESPKCYDVFSYVALWNPLRFYFDWGYDRYTKNLLSHDGYLSSGSNVADDQMERLLRKYNKNMGQIRPHGFNHTLSEPIYSPNLKEPRIFYAGINWERIDKKKGRHYKLIKILDEMGISKIYGPYKLNNVKVWKGFKTYSGQIPFDGVSLVREAAKCGISLVFSSDAHVQSGLMSNRLFESIAAGSVVICDDNPFAHENFGDSLLYVDFSKSEESIIKQVISHYKWIVNNKEIATRMAENAQRIFLEKFNLTIQLDNLIKNHQYTVQLKKNQHLAINEIKKVAIIIFIYFINKYVVDNIINNINNQSYKNITAKLFIDAKLRDSITINSMLDSLKYYNIDYNETYIESKKRNKHLPIGGILRNYISEIQDGDLFVIMNLNEIWFSDNISYMVRKFEDQYDLDLVVGDYIVRHFDDQFKMYNDFFHAEQAFNNWYTILGNMMVSKKIIDESLEDKIYTQYLHYSFFIKHLLQRSRKIETLRFPSVVVDIRYDRINAKCYFDDEIQHRIISEYVNDVGKYGNSENDKFSFLLDNDIRSNVNLRSDLESMNLKERQEIIKLLVKSLKYPVLVRKVLKYIYKFILSNK